MADEPASSTINPTAAATFPLASLVQAGPKGAAWADRENEKPRRDRRVGGMEEEQQAHRDRGDAQVVCQRGLLVSRQLRAAAASSERLHSAARSRPSFR